MLWRHGQTVWNFEDRFQGQTDIPLNDTGVMQAERAARLLAALRPDAIFASDLSRAAATAAPLARITGLPVTHEKDLRERHGGVWEGLTGPEIRTGYPAEFRTWLPPEGETTVAVADRVSGALGRISDSLPDGRWPSSLATARRSASSFGSSACPRICRTPGPLSNCSWSVLGRRRGPWRLVDTTPAPSPSPSSPTTADPPGETAGQAACWGGLWLWRVRPSGAVAVRVPSGWRVILPTPPVDI